MGAINGGFQVSDFRTAKVLVVDDRPDKLIAFESILQELQQEIFTAASGEEALKLLLEHEFAVVLLDVNMPRLDGFEVCRRLKADPGTADIKVVMLTARGADVDRLRAREAGADDYFVKPFSPIQLLNKVYSLLA